MSQGPQAPSGSGAGSSSIEAVPSRREDDPSAGAAALPASLEQSGVAGAPAAAGGGSSRRSAGAGSAPPPATGGRPEASRSLYVGKLHPSVNEAMLLEIFSTLGAVQEVKVIRDKLTSLSAGYGFITYYDPR